MNLLYIVIYLHNIYIYMNNIDVTDLPYCLAAAWNSNEACFEGFDPEHRVSSHLFNHS